MGYTNGIGSGQEISTAIATTESSNAARVSRTESSAVSSASGSEHNGSASSQAVDVTELSAASGAMTQALQGSDVRADKVAALQQTIAAGTYSVSAAEVAAKVMSALLE